MLEIPRGLVQDTKVKFHRQCLLRTTERYLPQFRKSEIMVRARLSSGDTSSDLKSVDFPLSSPNKTADRVLAQHQRKAVSYLQHYMKQAQWSMPVISALKKQQKENQRFKVILNFIVQQTQPLIITCLSKFFSLILLKKALYSMIAVSLHIIYGFLKEHQTTLFH